MLQLKPKTVVQLKDELQWSTLLQKSIAKCVKDFHKHLDASVSANGGPFNVMSLFKKEFMIIVVN